MASHAPVVGRLAQPSATGRGQEAWDGPLQLVMPEQPSTSGGRIGWFMGP